MPCIEASRFTSSVHMTDRWRPPVQILTSTKQQGAPLRKMSLTPANRWPHSIETHLPMAGSIADMLTLLLCVPLWWNPFRTCPASLKPQTSMILILLRGTDVMASIRSSTAVMHSGTVSLNGVEELGFNTQAFFNGPDFHGVDCQRK